MFTFEMKFEYIYFHCNNGLTKKGQDLPQTHALLTI